MGLVMHLNNRLCRVWPRVVFMSVSSLSFAMMSGFYSGVSYLALDVESTEAL